MRYRLRTPLLAIGGMPCFIYPFVLLAGVMSLGGHRTEHESMLLNIVSGSFLVGSIAYPGVYFACLIATLAGSRTDSADAWISAIPLFYLGVVVALFVAWTQISN